MSYAQTYTENFEVPGWVQRRMHHAMAHKARMMAAMSDETEAADGGSPRGRRGGHRGGPHGRPGFGPGPWGGRGPWGPPRGRRRDRGDVKAAILLLLAERPRHGYEIITELTDRSEGRWQPSPGSVYPVLKRLSRDGIVTATPEDGKAVFSLTEAGRALVEAEGASWGEPWLRPEDLASTQSDEMLSELRQVAMAATQVSQLQDPEQIEAATAILVEARKKIYGLLAQ